MRDRSMICNGLLIEQWFQISRVRIILTRLCFFPMRSVAVFYLRPSLGKVSTSSDQQNTLTETFCVSLSQETVVPRTVFMSFQQRRTLLKRAGFCTKLQINVILSKPMFKCLKSKALAHDVHQPSAVASLRYCFSHLSVLDTKQGRLSAQRPHGHAHVHAWVRCGFCVMCSLSSS